MTKLKKCAALFLVVVMLISLTACGEDFVQYRPISDVNNMDGRRVGVILAYGVDLLLTKREDLTLYRYDDAASLIAGLVFHQIDAMALNKSSWSAMKGAISGLEEYKDPLDIDEIILAGGKESGEIIESFNHWLAKWRKTEEYEDWKERYLNFGEIKKYDEEVHGGNGKVIRIADIEEYYPTTYVNEKGYPEGYEIEMLLKFAEDNDYYIEWVPGSETNASMEVYSGRADMVIGAFSNYYRKEMEGYGFVISDPYIEDLIVLVEVKDYDNLKLINSDLFNE